MSNHPHRIPEEEQRYHSQIDPHRGGDSLSDVILGGQDGLVNVLGVILGVVAATHDSRIVLAAGMAAAFAESVSMGAVAYTSTQAKRSYYLSEREREFRHIRNAPNLEREEIREIYRRKGFKGELLEKIVATITADPEVWVSVMLAEEYQIPEIPGEQPLWSAFVVLTSALVGSFIPLVPFLVLAVRPAVMVSVVISTVALFAVGVYKARVSVGAPLRSGIEMAVIGMLSAFVGYGIGWMFQAP